MKVEKLSRRDWLKLGAAGVAGLSGATVLDLAARGGARRSLAAAGLLETDEAPTHGAHPQEGAMGVVGDPRPDGDFDPGVFLTDFDYGEVSRTEDGRTVRDWQVVAVDREIEVAPGVWYPAWTYNGQVPGPTFRCTEGDLLRVEFMNAGSHPHTIHFHGTHPPEMDGVVPVVKPGERFLYEFEAKPFGLHLYHCHTMPLKRHIHKGLYGTFIVDPPGGRTPAREMVMVMNGFDTNFDGENEVYAVNTSAFYYDRNPIRVGVGDLCRVFLVNTTEFDPVNSFHLHASMFRLYRTGTRPDQYELTDTIMMCQGERHILEFELENRGVHMFHAHQSEFAELGWMGFFQAVEQLAEDEGVPVHRYV
ncbi:MAG: multicopper oxidase domain-containing protein [Gemmatimonadota bacterium]|nr:multicopper oxidase domain-containing protein [Gemmatimonadota bacterium]